MSPLKSNRLAWSVAAAALALWATSVPSTWGQVASGAARLFDQTDDTTSTSTTSSTTITTSTGIDISDTSGVTVMTNDGAPIEPCVPIPPAVAEILPSVPHAMTPPTTTPPGADQGTFNLCSADPGTAKAIEDLIAGRGFSSSLIARGNGCAELTVRATSPATSGSATSNLNVSIGSGRSLSIRIVSENGATRVTLSEQ
jgi:hypothetical protein